MGMDSRQYQLRRPSGGNWITPTIKQLFIVMAVVFVAQTMIQAVNPQAYRWIVMQFGVVPTDFVFSFKLWQPVTYIFLHGGLLHWLLNMLALYMFGCDVERVWGAKRFLKYFLVTGVGAGLCVVLVKMLASMGGYARSDIPTIGSSGAIYGVLLAAAVLFPDRQIWLFPFPVTMPMRPFVFVIGLIAFIGTLGAGGDGVSDVAHLSGLFIGWMYLRRGTYFFSVRNWIQDYKRNRMKRKFEGYMRKQEDKSKPDDWVN